MAKNRPRANGAYAHYAKSWSAVNALPQPESAANVCWSKGGGKGSGVRVGNLAIQQLTTYASAEAETAMRG